MIHLTFHDCTSYFGCLSSQSPLWEDRGKMILVKRLEADFRNMSNKVKKKKKCFGELCVSGIWSAAFKIHPFCILYAFFSFFAKQKEN